MGGETNNDVKNLMVILNRKNIEGIIDYAVESDITNNYSIPNYDIDQNKKIINFFNDNNKTQILSSVKLCEENMEGFDLKSDKYYNTINAFIKSIDLAAETKINVGFIAIKVTSICNPQHLNSINTYISNLTSLFDLISDNNDLMDYNAFKKALCSFLNNNNCCNEEFLKKYFEKAKFSSKNDKIILSQWIEFLNPKKDILNIFENNISLHLGEINPYIRHELNLIRSRINYICNYAKQKNVKVLIDAEQTYYQTAIHTLAMEFMQKFNTDNCIVYNTYQAYLKKTLKIYLDDLRTASGYFYNKPFLLGAKLVRGAYLEQEKQLSNFFNIDSPVCENYNETNLSFLRCLVAIMDSIKNNNGAGLIATHNIDSIKDSIDLIEENKISRNDTRIIFSQLLGMCTFVTNILAKNNYNICKYIPFGPIETVLPYMLRRINENKSVLDRLNFEINLTKNEIKKRLNPREKFST